MRISRKKLRQLIEAMIKPSLEVPDISDRMQQNLYTLAAGRDEDSMGREYADKSFDAAEIIYPDLLRRATEKATAEASHDLEKISKLEAEVSVKTRLANVFENERDEIMAELKAAKQEISELKSQLNSLVIHKKQTSEDERNFMGNLMDLMKGRNNE